MDQSLSTSEATIHPYNSASCEKSSPQETAVLPFNNSSIPSSAQICLEGNSSAEALTRNPAENIAIAAGITVSWIPDSAYNSEHEDSPEQEISYQPLQRNVRVSLLDEKIWKEFYTIGNEMIVTKPGRHLFPATMVSLRGLDLTTFYDVSFKVTSADPYRYKFKDMKWQIVGMSEVNQNEKRQIYLHSNSPNSGEFWMRKPVSFKSVKITHNHASKSAHILVHTMHKYVVEIIITPKPGSKDPREIVVPVRETTFMAVSAYQNIRLTQLKIDNNPFAKGFRASLKPIAKHTYMMAGGFQHLPYNDGELERQTSVLTRMVHPGVPMVHPGVPMLHSGPAMIHPGTQILQSGCEIPQPAAQIFQPGGQIFQSGAQIFQPAGQILQLGGQILQPGGPILQPRSQILRPGSGILQPGGQTLQPVSQILQPVSQIIQPGSQILRPVSQIIQPGGQTLQPVSQILRPVSQIIQPGGQTLQPCDQFQPGFQILQPGNQILQHGCQTLQPATRLVQPAAGLVHPGPQTICLGSYTVRTPVANLVDRPTPVLNPHPVLGTSMPPHSLCPIQTYPSFVSSPPAEFNLPRRMIADRALTTTRQE